MKARFGAALAAAFLLVCLIVSCATGPIRTESFKTWDIHSEAQAAYLASEDYTKPHLVGAKGASEMSKPVSPTFVWKYASDIAGSVASSYLLISESETLEEAKAFEVPAGETTFTVADGGMNLKVDTTYFWQVKAVLADGTEVLSGVEQFTTEGGIRNISVDGVTNFRDLGGKTTLDGATVKQGMLYRSGRYNVKYEKTLLITDLGLEQVDELGIKTDVDLRGDKLNDMTKIVYANGYLVDGSEPMVSPLGEDVNYVLIPRIWDNSLLSAPAGATMMQELFDVLCDESNYPVVFHCSIGTDRTGVSAFLIGCALGLSDEDLIRDYLFSNFGDIGSPRLLANFSLAISGIKNYDGETYQQKGLNYLLDKGITQEQIDKLKSILLEY